MGGTHRRDHAYTAHDLLKMCVSLLHSFLILMACTAAQASSTRHRNRQHSTSCANTRSMSYLYPQPLPPTARSTALQHQCVTHSHSSTSRIHSTATASSCQPVGTVGERSWCCATASTQKRGARHGSVICRLTLESTRTATTVRSKCMQPSWRTKVPKYVPSPLPHLEH